jgi:hypothetical protein
MRVVRTLWLAAVLTLIVLLTTSGGRAQGPATQFFGIGDLPGNGVNSIVQEATQVGSVIYAVGASTRTAINTPIPNLDTSVVWDSATNALTIIPDLVTFLNPPNGPGQPTGTNSGAFAITLRSTSRQPATTF